MTNVPIETAFIKGTGLAGIRDYLRKTMPDGEFEDFLNRRLSPERVRLFAGLILATTKYPIEVEHELLEAFKAEKPRTCEQELRSMGQDVARKDLKGVYKTLIKLASVERTLATIPAAWGFYFSNGTAKLVDKTPGRYVYTIDDPTAHSLQHPITAGWLEEAVTVAGAKTAQVQIEAGEHSDQVRMVVTWEK